MYAVIQTGGKQYRVAEGDILRVELLDQEPKQSVEFDHVLLVGTDADLKVGRPMLAGAKVTAEVIRHGRGKKVFAFKKKNTRQFQKIRGHRQGFTEIRVKSIKA